MLKRLLTALAASYVLLTYSSPLCFAQSTGGNSGTVRGSILDPSGAAIPGATIEIQNPISGYDKSVRSNAQGSFELDNIPFNNYHLSASAPGFQGSEQDVNVRSAIPLDVKISVKLGTANQTVTVTEAGDLVETDPTTHTDVDRGLFDKLPLESSSSSLSSLVTLATPWYLSRFKWPISWARRSCV